MTDDNFLKKYGSPMGNTRKKN